MSQFAFLADEFPALFDPAKKTELAALSDPRSACFHARLTLEIALLWMFRSDKALKPPYQDTLEALAHEPSLAALTGPAIVAKAVGLAERHVSRQLRLAYLAPGVLKRLVCKREVPTVTLLKLTDVAALPWDDQPERVFD